MALALVCPYSLLALQTCDRRPTDLLQTRLRASRCSSTVNAFALAFVDSYLLLTS